MKESKHIFISGTSKGIGFELANYYLNEGNNVAGISRSESAIQHPNYIHFKGDISIEKDIISCISHLKKNWTTIDVLINNAALAHMNNLITSPYHMFKEISDVNIGGTFLFMREISKMMIRKNFGRIINFTTVSNPLNLETQVLYASSKAAVESMTKIAAYELGAFGITVNAIGPNPIETDLIKGIPAEWLNNVIQRQAIKRLGTIEDLTNLIDFLIKPESNFITGQTLYLGGVS